MVTGDQHAIAVETSKRLGLGTNIMEGAKLLEDDDFEKLCIEVSAVWVPGYVKPQIVVDGFEKLCLVVSPRQRTVGRGGSTMFASPVSSNCQHI